MCARKRCLRGTRRVDPGVCGLVSTREPAVFRNSLFSIPFFAIASTLLFVLWWRAVSSFPVASVPVTFALLGACMFGGTALVYGLDLLDAIWWRSQRLAAGVVVRPQAEGCVLTIAQYSPLAWAGVAVWGSGTVGVLVWVVITAIARPNQPAWWVQFVVCGIVLATGPTTYLLCRIGRSKGKRDLIIDRAMRTVWCPPGPARERGLSIGLAELTDVDVVVWEHVVQTRYGTTTVYTYVPTIVYRSQLGAWKTAHLVEWRDQGKAEALARWLRKELDVV